MWRVQLEKSSFEALIEVIRAGRAAAEERLELEQFVEC
jgi:urease accessory protein UreH